jgi:hypothetical protein
MGLLSDGVNVPTSKPRAAQAAPKAGVASPPAPEPAREEQEGLGTVEEVLAAVDAGELDATETLRAEQTGKGRVTLIEALQDRVVAAEGDSATD